MYIVERTRETNHSKESLWEALASFNEIYIWNPAVKSSPGTPREDFAIGAARVCHFDDGTSVNEKVVAMDPGRSMDIELSEFSMPLKEARARLSISVTSTGATITFRMEFVPKFGILGDLLAIAAMKPKLGKMIDEVLEGLDEHLRVQVAAA